MRSWLKSRWLEELLLLGLVGLMIWFLHVGLGFVPEPLLVPAPTTAAPTRIPTRRAVPTAAPMPTVTPMEVQGPYDGAAAYEHVLAQTRFGPRPSGSEASKKTQTYISRRLREYGWQVETQDFTYMGTGCRNIIAKAGSGPLVILGAHYDTRSMADNDPDVTRRVEPVLGANDGGSGVAVLLELARSLDYSKLHNEVWLSFFDAADNGGLEGWDFNAGSTYMAKHLTVTPSLVVIVDMVGQAHQTIYRERNSSAVVMDRIWQIARELNYAAYFRPDFKYAILDDHTPFIRRGIPAIDLIDFDYPYWHTTQDTADKVDPDSLEHVGQVLKVLLENPALEQK